MNRITFEQFIKTFNFRDFVGYSNEYKKDIYDTKIVRIYLPYDYDEYKNELEDKIDKAIEYIKGWQSFPHTNGSTHNELRNLLNILEGSDKE